MTDTIFYIAVNRDDAKQLFGTKEPTALRTLIAGWITTYAASDQLLKLGESWLALREHFRSECEKAPSDDAQLAITSLFDGNRSLLDDAGFRVTLVRPDAVGAVAHFLSKESEDVPENVLPVDVRETQAKLQKLFSAAIVARQAIAIVQSSKGFNELDAS